MSFIVDFENVTTDGVESSPVATALAGLRANEARYFKNKYGIAFSVEPASDSRSQSVINFVHTILKEERNIVIASAPLESAAVRVNEPRWGDTTWVYVFYESGLAINIPYATNDPKGRAVGFKLSDGMDIPAELSSFKFARQKSRLAGTIRGSYFVIKGEYDVPHVPVTEGSEQTS